MLTRTRRSFWVVSGYVSIDYGRMVCMRSLGPHTTIGEMGLMTGLNGALAQTDCVAGHIGFEPANRLRGPWAQKKVHERNFEGGGSGWFGANQP